MTPLEKMAHDATEKGLAVICTKCDRRKVPRGRSVPLEMHGSLCDQDCEGWDQGDCPTLWPGEDPMFVFVEAEVLREVLSHFTDSLAVMRKNGWEGGPSDE